MYFDSAYFRDEIREGFYIPGMIKRSWAQQIEVLNIVSEICDKYNVRWFADCGTLLGAVRHKGFIPWDDDLDICMLRNDYTRFKQIVASELPKGYKVLNFDTEAEHQNFLTRIVNTDEIRLDNDFLNDNHGFPYVAGIDVFPMDYLYPDAKREKNRRERALSLWNLTLEYVSGKLTEKDTVSRLVEIPGVNYSGKGPLLSNLHKSLECIFGEYDGAEAKYVTLMPAYLRREKYVLPVNTYDKSIKLPFENTYIVAPVLYENVLTLKYGKWYVAKQAGGAHNYPFYSEQESTVIEKCGRAPYIYDEKVNWEKIINERMIHKKSTDVFGNNVEVLKECHSVMRNCLSLDTVNEISDIIPKCQEIAILIGTNIEEKYGDNTETVKALETYCDMLFTLFTMLGEGNIRLAKDYLGQLNEQIEIIIKCYNIQPRKQEVLFVPTEAQTWKYMEPLYRYYAELADTEVYVMPAQFADRTADGKMSDLKNDYQELAKLVPITTVDEYDFKKHHPDRIIIQNAYDEYESGFTIHPFFYASRLCNMTDSLVFCHSFTVDEISENDEKALKNAEKYVYTPGVMLADEIYVPNLNMKRVYSFLLSKLEKTMPYKIEVIEQNETVVAGRKNYIAFCVSDNDLFIKTNTIQQLEKTINFLKNSADRYCVLWVEDELTRENLKCLDINLYQQYMDIHAKFQKLNMGLVISSFELPQYADKIAVFYGSAGYAMNWCIRMGAHAMHWNY